MKEALKAAARGWYLFPIVKNKKAPACFDDNLGRASNEPAQIKIWARQYPGCNWGLACGPSNLTAVDIDPKNGGDSTLKTLAWDMPLPETLTVSTPSGGFHFYYSGAVPKSNTSGKLGKGIDVKSTGGYVILPGSHTEEELESDGRIKTYRGDYAWLKDCPLAKTPEWIIEVIGQASEKDPNRETPLCELDDPHAISRAVTFLQKEASIDITGYEVACQVRDLGISQDTCFLLMWEHYADRCDEPWEPEILEQKVKNAYKYAQNPAGVTAPQEILSLLPDVPAEKPLCLPRRCLAHTIIKDIPARQWVLGRRYLRPYITLTVAPGGAGKSILTMLEAIAIATGRPLTGEQVYLPGRVWIYNLEDPQDELDRRLAAITLEYQVTPEEQERIFSTSGWDRPLILVKDSKQGPIENIPAIRSIIETIKTDRITHLVVDPLVKCHTLQENDNTGMDKVITAFAKIGAATGCSISLVHHAKKGKATAGDIESSRGASSVAAAVRIAHTLSAMQPAEAKIMGIPEKEASWFVRLDDAKGNLAPPGVDARWFERVSVILPNGDATGVMKRTRLTSEEILSEEQKNLILSVFKLWNGPVTCYRMAQELVKHSESEKGKNAKSVNERIAELFKGVERSHSGRILTAKLGEGKKTKALILECVDEAPETPGRVGADIPEF